MKGSITKRLTKMFVFCLLCLTGVLWGNHSAQASLWSNPYITFSPDGQAFTTNADEKDTEWYRDGYTVNVGNPSSLGEPKTGEHLYNVIQKGTVEIGNWTVYHEEAVCSHRRITDVANFHGVFFTRDICLEKYYSGWLPYCADCGERVTDYLFYMSREAAASLKEIDMSLAYYYRCPHCTHLEQGIELGSHVCKGISANQYSVRYHANFGKGFMPKSIHMYDNATCYEGEEVTPQTHLTLNSYERVGYEFAGWNTKSDGSGQSFGDGQEILNLCSGEQESIVLYAQWKRSRSVLEIDPAGGKYGGSPAVTKIGGDYGSEYVLSSAQLEAPAGTVVHFDSCGGEAVRDMTVSMEFFEWSLRIPFSGELQEGIYTFRGKDGSVDRVTAVYKPRAVILPECKKEGSSFGGWYFDQEGTRPAGAAGTEFLPAQEVTLYARWVDIKLEAEDNYLANGGAGAVNLSWQQKDNIEKTYLIYQKQQGGDWERIHSAEEILTEKHIYKNVLYTGNESSYTIPYSGYYKLTAYGAQGGNCGAFQGGKGGGVSAVIYFEKGEKIQYVIGGQNGYHGGGSGSMYGNGGGMTSVSAKDRGTLLIAGGGGGASAVCNGNVGGSSLGNVEGSQGQAGIAGGGGGYLGGAAGSAMVHQHSAGCSHNHEGSPDACGGCYTVAVPCGGTSFDESLYMEVFYYGNIDNDGNHILCVRCDSDFCPGHTDRWYHYTCNTCDTNYDNDLPDYCTKATYALGCGYEEGVSCGYEAGEVIGATAAYGGSNYVNAAECLNYEEYAGIKEFDGMLVIESVQIGFTGDTYLNGVKATDYAAPGKISIDTVEIKAVDENKVNVVFARPEDEGTTYYHVAESYAKATGGLISTSNQTVNTLISGVQGYYYRVDGMEGTNVTKQDSYCGDSGAAPYIGVTVSASKQFLHVAAVDRAGNLSQTTHISISTQDMIFWPLLTRQIEIEEKENVYKAQDVYYVRADETTPFKVSFLARLCGTALKNYQINRMNFISQNVSSGQGEGVFSIITPTETVITAGSKVYRGENIQKQYENAFCLTDMSFTELRRSNYCKDLVVTQTFSVARDMDGQKIRLTPRAGVTSAGVGVWSEESSDFANSIYLVADGAGALIRGLDIPEEVINTEDGKWQHTLQVYAEDWGSGLKELWLEIKNIDSGAYEKIEDVDMDGHISLELSPENPLFAGEFTIIAAARDRVGNEAAQAYGMDTITINAYIEKLRETSQDAFKKGESGILHIQTTGYMEKVEVTFPQEWIRYNPELNRTFIYEVPRMMQGETVEFMIPLQVSGGEYRIQIKAYKGDQSIEVRPGLLTVNVHGSILEEIRTRLR